MLSQKWLFLTIRVFGPYYSNIRIIFGPKILTEYRIEYHYSVPNYSNIRIIRTICSNTVTNLGTKETDLFVFKDVFVVPCFISLLVITLVSL